MSFFSGVRCLGPSLSWISPDADQAHVLLISLVLKVFGYLHSHVFRDHVKVHFGKLLRVKELVFEYFVHVREHLNPQGHILIFVLQRHVLPSPVLEVMHNRILEGINCSFETRQGIASKSFSLTHDCPVN